MPMDTRRSVLSTTAEKVVELDPNRTDLYFCNEDAAIIVRVGTEAITVAAGGDETAGFAVMPGATLPVQGGPQAGSAVAAQEWWAIAESGTPALSILEYLDR